jgi:hypothetical protein
MGAKKGSPTTAIRKLARCAGDGVRRTRLDPISGVEVSPVVPIDKEQVARMGSKALIYAEAYVRTGSQTLAYMEVSRCKTPASAQANASRYHKKVVELAGGQDAWLELLGLSHGAIVKVLADGMKSTTSHVFITRDGTIIQAPEVPDTPSRLSAAKLALQARGIFKEGGGDHVLQVNIVQYAPPGSAPWPTSGKTIDVTDY